MQNCQPIKPKPNLLEKIFEVNFIKSIGSHCAIQPDLQVSHNSVYDKHDNKWQTGQ